MPLSAFEGKPLNTFMVEIRAKKDAENKSLRTLANASLKLADNQKRLAFIFVRKTMRGSVTGADIKEAFLKCLIEGAGVINKAHLRYHPEVLSDVNHMAYVPVPKAGEEQAPLHEIDVLAFDGFDKKGNKVSKASPSSSKGKKKAGGKNK